MEMMYRNLYRSKIQVWTQYENRKCTKDQVSNSENCITPKQETKNSIKVLQEVMTFFEKHDYDKTCMDSKRKRHKHMIGTIKKRTIKLKISLKREM